MWNKSVKIGIIEVNKSIAYIYYIVIVRGTYSIVAILITDGKMSILKIIFYKLFQMLFKFLYSQTMIKEWVHSS